MFNSDSNKGFVLLSIFLSMTFAFRLIIITVKTTGAVGIVGDGTPESCTDAALTTALSGGGLVTFNK